MTTVEVGVAPVSENTLAYAGPTQALLPILAANREPTTSDTRYIYGQMWFNTADGSFWIRTNSSAVWVNLAPGGTGAATVPDGGTGQTSLTDHAVLLGQGVDPVGFVGPAAAGTVLQGAGAGSDPAFSTATYPLTTAKGDILSATAADTITSLTFNATPTRYLANTGDSASVAAWDQVNLANGVTGVLSITNGGTGVVGVSGTTTTSGAVSSTIITFPCGATSGLYTFIGTTMGIETTGGGNRASYPFRAAIYTDGATATLIDDGRDQLETAGFISPVDVDMLVAVSGNDVLINASGDVGFDINWSSIMTYTFLAE